VSASAPRIRAATPEDASALARLRYEFRASIGVPDEPREGFVERCVAWMTPRLMPDARWRAWVAEGPEGIVGAVWIGLIEKMPNPIAEPEEHGYLTNFYVQPTVRGTGTGTALLDSALGWCAERGVHAVMLWPTERSRALYERHGFAAPSSLMERIVTGDAAPWPSPASDDRPTADNRGNGG
jgi:GNAT superfamily N-acetyltransferase